MKYIFLDIDGTLLDFEVYEHAAFQAACDTHHISYTNAWYHRYHDINLALWKQHELGLIKREELIYTRFSKLFAEMEVQVDAHSFEHKYQEALAQGCHYVDGAIEILEYLEKKYELYIVTNGIAVTQHKKITSAGIDRYVKSIFISEELGAQKPKKEFFDACFAQINDISKEEVMIIGDSLSSDIKGGNNAGIKTCWFNPKHEVNDTDIKVDKEIHLLSELKGIL